jgi:OOP family OmpA-OmpF porin
VKTIQRLAVASVVSIFAISAHADNWYVVGSVGQSKMKDFSKSDTDNALDSVGFTTASSTLDDTSNGYKIQIGYHLVSNIAIEGGYVDLGKAKYKATGTVAGNAATASADFKASGINIASIVSFPISDQFDLFAKLGLINGKVDEHASASIGGVSASDNSSSTDVKNIYGIGASYNFSKSIGVRVEFERFGKLGNSGTTDETDVDLLSVGLVGNF